MEGIIPEVMFCDLVNLVKSEIGVSYMKSKVIVDVVLSELAVTVPGISNIVNAIRSRRQTNLPSGDFSFNDDTVVLKQHFDEVAMCKDSSEHNRSIINENELLAKKRLDDMFDILDSADPEMCKRVIEEDHYTPVHMLVLYYLAEPRVQLRLVMIQIFGALCELDARIISVLKDSVLPAELARDMRYDVPSSQKFIYSCFLLTMIFSTGEPLPVEHYGYLNEKYVSFLFDLIENPPPDDVGKELPDRIIPVILAFNLHLAVPEENSVMNALSKQLTVTRFLEELMILVNKEVDPVQIIPRERHPPNSIMKFLCDMYSRQDTAKLFHTSDEKLLAAILLRHIQDCTSEDELRTEYLSVFHLLLKNSTYNDHCHHHKDLQEVLMSVCLEDDSSENAMKDKQIIKKIWKEFPHLFFT